MTLALLLYVPLAWAFGIVALKVMAILSPAGMLKVPQTGVALPAAGSTMAVRVAAPFSVMAVVDARVNADGRVSVNCTPAAVAKPVF